MPHFRVNSLKLKSYCLSEEELISSLRKRIPIEFDLQSENLAGKNIYKTNFQIGKTLEHTLGLIYVQSKSSMISAITLSPSKNEKVLDLCSAPGSKTTLLAELMNNTGFILANEISFERIKALMFNIDRIGILNTTISNFDGIRLANLLPNYFDKILVDPPCTALGNIKFTPRKQIERNLSRLENLTQIQYQLLVSAAKMLKTGGEIVYSTCTTTLEENEYLIQKFLNKYPFEIVQIDLQGIKTQNETGQKIMPDLFHSIRIDPTDDDEGFFIVKLKKLENFSSDEPILNPLDKETIIYKSESNSIREILEELSEHYDIQKNLWKNFNYILRSGDIFFFTANEFDYGKINFIRSGIKLASFDKKTGWRLSSNAIQILGNEITKEIVNLNSVDDLKSYFMGQKTKIDHPDSDFVVVKFKDYFLGGGKISNSTLLSYFPRSRRTLEIDFKLID